MKLEIETTNEAFEGWKNPYEVAEILAETRKKILHGDIAGTLRDANGNTVGKWRL